MSAGRSRTVSVRSDVFTTRSAVRTVCPGRALTLMLFLPVAAGARAKPAGAAAPAGAGAAADAASASVASSDPRDARPMSGVRTRRCRTP